MYFTSIIVFMLGCICRVCTAQTSSIHQDTSFTWKEGFLDIHHINTGRGNAAFIIFPDGTTMLFDAGELNVETFKSAPLKITPVHPFDSITPGAWITQYIRQVLPKGNPLQIDYAVISHFHSDHYGALHENSEWSKTGKFRLTGITTVGENIPIKTLIDRAGPSYNYPVPLQDYYKKDSSFLNYLNFLEYATSQKKLHVETLVAGSNNQIRMQHKPGKYPDFQVRNVKSNGLIWTGKEQQVEEYLTSDSIVDKNGKFGENPLSLALKISYGHFDYFTGGDNTGLQGYGLPEWFDVETPMAKAVGQVEALTLNHHGNRDATNQFFLQTLKPRVIVQQVWCSDHPGQEVLHRMISQSLYQGPRDLFATNMHQETQITLGPWLTKNFLSMQGHILIRVVPGGGHYYVYILDDNSYFLRVMKKYGPYQSK